MKAKLIGQPDSQIRYLRFLNNTLQIGELRKDVCDEFTRKIFDYLEGEPLFDAQVFSAFIYYLIFQCKQIQPAIRRDRNPIDTLRFAFFRNDLIRLFNSFSPTFTLDPINPNQFNSVSIKEKLKHLLVDDESPHKGARVEIILPENNGKNKIVPFVSLDFTLPRLSLEQNLDIIHFTICALNYLSQKDNPLEHFQNAENSRKSESFKIISDEFTNIRNSVIKNAFREKELFGESEFDESLPDIKRVLQAQNQDPKIERQWLDVNSPVFVKSEAATEEIDLDENLKITLSARQWVILLRNFINHYKDYTLRDIDITAFARLLAVMNGGKNQKNFYDKLRNQRGLVTAKTRDKAQEVANICRDVGFSKIADEIEMAIEKVK
jgi:hypothetical protein